jgi:hypothetical protein
MTRKVTDKEKELKIHLLFFAAGGIIFPCASVKDPWLKKS